MTNSTHALAQAPLPIKLEHVTNLAGFTAIDVNTGSTIAIVSYTPAGLAILSKQQLDSLASLMTAAPHLGEALGNVIELAEEGLRQRRADPTVSPARVQELELQVFDAQLLLRRLGGKRTPSGG